MTKSANGRFGIAVAASRRSMADGQWMNDTRKEKWTVDLHRDPKHVQILDDFPGGTRFVTPANSGNLIFRETLKAIKHHMPFPPKVLCYFYTKDAPAGQAALIGQYTQGMAYMITNAMGLGSEYLYIEVDDEYFYIKHVVYSSTTSAFTWLGDNFKYRVRYEILNQPALFLSTESS